MRSVFSRLLLLCLGFLFCKLIRAQDTTQSKQIWPEVDAYFRLNERFRLYGVISGTRSNSEYTDGKTGIFIDYFARSWIKDRRNETEMSDSAKGYFWWFRMGYSYSYAPPEDKQKVVNIFETETNNSFYLPERIVLNTRNRLDWRWVNGEFQPIYRPRMKFVRNFKTQYLTFNAYLYGEYYFYLNDADQDRFRLCIGSVMKVSKALEFELYYLHQFPNGSAVSLVDAIGLQINLYFYAKNYKK